MAEKQERLPLGFWSLLWKGADSPYTHRATASSSVHGIPSGTSLSMKSWVENTFYLPNSAMAHIFKMTEWLTCRRGHPAHQSLSPETWVLLGPVEYVDHPALIPAEAHAACKEGIGETPTDSHYTRGSIWGNW